MEEIEIEFLPEIVQDIEKHTIARATVDFIIHYENGLMTLKDLNNSKDVFVSEEFYNYAEAVKRALSVINIIFE